MLNRGLRRGMLGHDVPASIKSVSPDRLLELCGSAAALGLSATGRPGWIRRHEAEICGAILMPIGVDGTVDYPNSSWRCYAGVITKRNGVATFTLDVRKKDYDLLPSLKEPWEIAELVLKFAPFISVEDVER